ncbi:MAG: primosomal protein N' [Acidobacteria bacterium]|nr:primosomal protein N' [Acidobacteriota bacterium]
MSGSGWAVDVVLPVPLRRVFRYLIPESQDPSQIEPGYRVIVPFRNRQLAGISFSKAYAHQVQINKDRFLIRYESDVRILAPEIHQLLTWMLTYYHAHPGDLLKSVLPPGILTRARARYTLTELGRTWLDAHPNHADAHLLRLLARPLDLDAWQQKGQTERGYQQLREWEQQGLVQSVGDPQTAALPMRTHYTWCGPTDYQSRSKTNTALYQFLLGKTQISRETILQAIPNSGPALNNLLKQDLLRKEELPEFEGFQQEQREAETDGRILTAEQAAVFSRIEEVLESQTFQPFLLFGVTGSGKTEVYLRAIQRCLDQNRQALFLVPEIALTPMMQQRITDRFGKRLAILHSAVGKKRRSEDWARVLAGKVDLVLGARSAVFAPLPRLGLVIIDEEHDGSYKQQDGARYHARQVALVRAQQANACVILGSATPSLESWYNQLKGRYPLLTMKSRATQATLPQVEIVDMREEFTQTRKRPLFSRALMTRLKTSLEAGEQAMILLNRRGYHSFLLCRKCGEAFQCPHCSVTLTYHQYLTRLVCHFCEYQEEVPQQCPSCQAESKALHFFGEGTEQVEHLLKNQFPESVVDRLDRDRIKNLAQAEAVLDRFRRGETHILVGTQMIAKGHDFPNVTLVGIVNADIGLRVPDFRSAEWTFQLLTQVAGRSGRGSKPGSVVVQTYMPEHYSIRTAAEHDFEKFVQQELRYRRHMFYPPFSHMLMCMIQNSEQSHAYQDAQRLARALGPASKDFIVLGPSKASVAKVKDIFRFQILIKAAERSRIAECAQRLLVESEQRDFSSRVQLDIDPQQFG